jgi:hypothetical protein
MDRIPAIDLERREGRGERSGWSGREERVEREEGRRGVRI